MSTLTTAAAAYTHAGRRRSNQDSVVVRRLGTDGELIAVADGMGGHMAGEVASALTLEVLVGEIEAGTSLTQAVDTANARVFQSAHGREDWQGMGTTLVVLLRHGESYHIANVGDSRAYRLDGATISQITADHSYVAEALRSGAMSREDAARSPARNALTRAVGTDADVEVDLYGPFACDAPHAVLLCSDGLYKAVGDEMIREYLLSIHDLDTAVEILAALAYRRGSDDNITVAAVEFARLERRSPTITLPMPIRLQGGASTSSAAPVSPSTSPPPAAPASAAAAPRTMAGPAPDGNPRAVREAVPLSPQVPDEYAPGARRRKRRSRPRYLSLAIAVLSCLLVLAAAGWWWSL
jgi:PPM family protein phosphatase